MPEPRSRRKLLLVDDDPVARLMTLALLQNEQYDIRQADGGEEALLMARDWQPDLVLTDVLMPQMDGYELLRRLQAAKGPKILFYTGTFSGIDEKALAESGGALAVLKKPATREELQNAVAAALAHEPTSSMAPGPDFDREHLRILSTQLTHKVSELEKVNADLRSEVNHRRQIETELIRLKDQAEGLARAKTEFLNNVSHEMGTPMNAILGFSEILMEHPPFQDCIELGRIHANAQNLAHTLRDLISLSELEAHGPSLKPRKLVVADFIEAFASKHRPRIRVRGLDLHIDFRLPLPASVCGDPDVWERILTHLLDNSLKFTLKGHVTLRVLEWGRELAIEIEDTGQGISAEHQQRLFRAFQPGDGSLTRQHGGLGLGLLLSKRWAEACGGTLALVRSQAAVGTTFRLTVPRELPEDCPKSGQ